MGLALTRGNGFCVLVFLLCDRGQVLERVVPLRDDALARVEPPDHLDKAIVGDTEHECAALEALRTVLVLDEHVELARLLEERVLRDRQRQVGSASDEAQRGAHVRSQALVRVGYAHVDGERAATRVELASEPLDHTLEDVLRVARDAHPHLLTDRDLPNLALEDAADGQHLAEIRHLEEMPVRLHIVAHDDVAVRHDPTHQRGVSNPGRWVAELEALDLDELLALLDVFAFVREDGRDATGDAARHRPRARGVRLDLADDPKRRLDGAQFGLFDGESEVALRYFGDLDGSSDGTGRRLGSGGRRMILAFVRKRRAGHAERERDGVEEESHGVLPPGLGRSFKWGLVPRAASSSTAACRKSPNNSK